MKQSLSKIKYRTKNAIGYILFMLFRVVKIQNNKIVATTMRARKYGDNPKYIVEQLLVLNPNLDIVWMRAKHSNFEVPKGIRACNYNNPIKRIYEYATAKVWINSHRIESYVRKRKGQVFIETWHGGLGMKKIENGYRGCT